MPAFGPPTWAVLVFFRFRYPEIPPAALVVGGAIAASAGRLVLALAFRALGTKLPAKRRDSLLVLGHVLGEQRGGLLASFALFAIAPIPSAQLFEAAGLAGVRLWPLLLAFLFGRLVSYASYVTVASAAHDSLRHIFDQGLLSPQAIATQLIGIAVLLAIVFIDWPSVIDKVRGWWAARRGRPAPTPIRELVLPQTPPANDRPPATA
jgi:uncharacterized membrane protein YdjX (TVP38/TMEM64 family)